MIRTGASSEFLGRSDESNRILSPIAAFRSPKNDVPFVQRPACTIREACQAAGLGRTKLYELIKSGTIKTTTVGRRRLVSVPSLLKAVQFGEEPEC